MALRPTAPKPPFGVPDSVRLLDPTMPQGSTMGFTDVDPNGNPVTVTNEPYNFGWEYVWHCHILSHEEMDMMRPMQFNVATSLPAAPVLYYSPGASAINLTWTDATPATDPATLGNPANEIGFRIERADVDASGNARHLRARSERPWPTRPASPTPPRSPASTYSYRVVAFNAAGEATSNAVSAVSRARRRVAAPTNLTATLLAGPQVSLTWTDNATNETGFVVQRSDNGGAFATIATPAAQRRHGHRDLRRHYGAAGQHLRVPGVRRERSQCVGVLEHGHRECVRCAVGPDQPDGDRRARPDRR